MSKILKGLDEAYGRYGRRDAYQRDYDASVAGMNKRDSYAYQMDGGANDEGWDEPQRDYTPKPVARKGMYFYNVPAGQDSKAQEVGLFRTKSGKWYSPFQNTRADMFFGKGRYWEPKTNESQLDELSNDTLASYKKKAGADASAADKAGDYKRGDKRFSGIVKATKKQFDNDSKGVVEASPDATFNVLKGLKSYQVVIMNNYYRGKYSDYSGRYYYVLATSPEEAKQVVLDNADAILQDLLAMKAHNGRRILPRSSAVPITPDRIGKIEDGTVAGRMSTTSYKKMYSPNGPMMVKLSNGAIEDVQGQEQNVSEETIHVGYRDSSGDWIKTTTHTNYADAKAAMERLVKRGKKGVQHRYDNKGNIDPGAMMTARPDSGVAEDTVNESSTIDFIRGLISEFNTQMSGSPYYPMDYKNPGMRMWTRGDGSRYKDPGYIFIDRDLKPEDQPKWHKAKAVEKFWKFLESKGARKIGDVSGEFGSDPHSPAVVLNKQVFVFNGRSIAWGSTSRLKNSSVWRQKQQGVAEGWDPDTTRLEQDVRDALDNGDDYTAKQYAKMAPTPEAKKYLLNIIKQAMYIDDLGGEIDWKGVSEAGNKPVEKYRLGMGDNRTARELKTQMQGASDEFVNWAAKDVGPFHSRVAKMQGKLAKSELRRRAADHDRLATGTNEGVAEGEKNPHTSALGKALYRDLSKEKKASPQQVQRNKERWAKRQADMVGDPAPQHYRDQLAKDAAEYKKGVSEGELATYLVSVMDSATGEHWRIEVKVTSPEMAKERAEAMGYKVLGVKEKPGVAEGSSTMWEVSFDYGPHQADSVKVKAGSEEEAIAKVEKAAEKRGRDIMINWARPAEQDVAEEKQRLDAKCWKGYKKQGTKMKGDTRVNNCVPVKESAIMKGLK
jgi:hypothetical protein